MRGQVIRFDAKTINDFLNTPIILAEGEEYLTCFQYVNTYLDHQDIVAALCTPEGGFISNADRAP